MRFKTSNGKPWNRPNTVCYFNRHVLYNDPLGCNESHRDFYATLADWLANET